MTSGNFVIKPESYTSEFTNIFNKYFLPIFEREGVSVTDKVNAVAGHSDGSFVFSIRTDDEKDLEEVMDSILLEAGEQIKKEAEDAKVNNSDAYYRWQNLYSSIVDRGTVWVGNVRKTNPKGQYQTIGVYADSNAASEAFPAVSKPFILEETKNKIKSLADDIKRTISSLAIEE